MLDYFKELVSAANSRVRSPVLGSIAVVFIALNWKELFYVFFAKTSAQVRLSYFDVNTDEWSLFYWPLIMGIGLAISYPWINLVSSQLAKLPVRALKKMHGDEDYLRQVHSLENAARVEEAKAELEQEKERRVLAAAQRLKQAEDISPSAAEEIRENRKSTDESMTPKEKSDREILRRLSPVGIEILGKLARDPTGEGAIYYSKGVEKSDSELSFKSATGEEEETVFGAHRRVKLDVEAELELLEKFGLTERTGKVGEKFVEHRITTLGYAVSDLIQ